jgi:hypothetical protein
MSIAGSGRVGSTERKTQNRVVALFRDRLDYDYGGSREDRDNGNVLEGMLRGNLLERGYDDSANQASSMVRRVFPTRTHTTTGASPLTRDG